MTICTTAGFSLDLSAGDGLDYTHSWSSVTAKHYNNSANVLNKDNSIGTKSFFDVRYAFLELGALFAAGEPEISSSSFIGGVYKSFRGKISIARNTYIHLGIFLKYPFT